MGICSRQNNAAGAGWLLAKYPKHVQVVGFVQGETRNPSIVLQFGSPELMLSLTLKLPEGVKLSSLTTLTGDDAKTYQGHFLVVSWEQNPWGHEQACVLLEDLLQQIEKHASGR